MKKQVKLNGLIAGSLMLVLNAGAADDLVFPNKDSSGDISSAAAWGTEDFSTKNAVFDKTQTVTALEDVSFAGLLKVTGGTLTLDMRNEATGADPVPRKLSFDGHVRLFKTGTSLVMRGGFWDLKSHYLFSRPDDYNNSGNVLTVTDGAVVTNVSFLSAGTYGENGTSHLYVQGASRIYADRISVDGLYGKDTTVEVSEGSKVSLVNADSSVAVIQTETQSSGNGNNGLRVSGEGSEVVATAGPVYAGQHLRNGWISVEDHGELSIGAASLVVGNDTKASNAVFRVSDHARFEMGNGELVIGNNGRNAKVEVAGDSSMTVGAAYLYLGKTAAASDAILRVADGATFMKSGGAVFLGYAATGCRIEVENGATLDLPGVMYVGGNGTGNPNCGMVISGGVYKGPMPKVGHGVNATNSFIRLVGAGTSFEATSSDSSYLELFSSAPNCSFVIDGASWTNAEKAITFGNTYGVKTHHCRLDIVNGGELVLPEKGFALATLNYAEPSNTVFVGEDSLLTAKSVAINSIHNTMIVSNGTVEATAGDFYVCREYQNGTAFNTNCCLMVQGGIPKVRATGGTLDVWRDSSVVFDLPENGYGEETPVVAKNIYFDSTSHLEVRGGENYLADREQSVEKTLMTATDTLTLSDAQVAAANAALPKGLKLRKSADKKSLVLKASGLGMMITIR